MCCIGTTCYGPCTNGDCLAPTSATLRCYWDKCGGSVVDCSTVLHNRHLSAPFIFELTANTGIVTLFNSWSEYLVNTDVSLPQMCVVSLCSVAYDSGVNFVSCISTPATYKTDIGKFTFNTNLAGCKAGSGTVRIKCGAGSTIPAAKMTISKVISISFPAPCSNAAVITP